MPDTATEQEVQTDESGIVSFDFTADGEYTFYHAGHETTVTVTSLSGLTYVDPPPITGPIVPYRSGTVLSAEENRRLAAEQNRNWSQVIEDVNQSVQEYEAQHQETWQQTAGDRASAEANVQSFADTFVTAFSGFEPNNTMFGIGEDGLYTEISLLYVPRIPGAR